MLAPQVDHLFDHGYGTFRSPTRTTRIDPEDPATFLVLDQGGLARDRYRWFGRRSICHVPGP